jgi:cytochrome c-type biogenesis protein
MYIFGITVDFSLLGILIAFFGGVISIISPCVLPILPGFAGIATGMSIEELENDKKFFSRVIKMCVSFSTGFSLVFIIVGLATTELGSKLSNSSDQLSKIAGAILILLSVFFLLSYLTNLRVFNFEKKFKYKDGLSSIPVLLIGAGFALGWSPCLGPILAGVIAVASSEQHIIGRIILLLSYSVGLCLAMSGIIIASFKNKKIIIFIRSHTKFIVIFTFIIMFSFGLVLLFDHMAPLTTRLTKFFDAIGLDKIANGL